MAQIVSQSTAQVNGEGTSDAGTICVSNSTLDALGQQACARAEQNARTKCDETCEKRCGLETPSAEGTCFQEVCYDYPVEVEGNCPLPEEQVRICRAAEDADLKTQIECLNPRIGELENKVKDCIERAKRDCLAVDGAFTTGDGMRRPPIQWRRP